MPFKTILLALITSSFIAATSFAAEAEQVAEVGVRTLMKSPEKYSRQVRVTGVVSQVVEDAKILGLIDSLGWHYARGRATIDVDGEDPERGRALSFHSQ